MCQAYEGEARLVTMIEHKYGSYKKFLEGGPRCECPNYPYEVDRDVCQVHGTPLNDQLEGVEKWAAR